MSGVPLDQLHCPTCGEQFTDFRLHMDTDVFDVDRVAESIKSVPWPRYLLCPTGHKWGVKVIWRSRNRPDLVLLDRYLGEQT
jgi:hypothetical protein